MAANGTANEQHIGHIPMQEQPMSHMAALVGDHTITEVGKNL